MALPTVTWLAEEAVLAYDGALVLPLVLLRLQTAVRQQQQVPS